MEKRLLILLVVIGLIGILGSQSIYMVHQTECAIVLELGKPKANNVKPGLHFKLPFVQNVIKFDARLLTYDSNPAEAYTSDKKNIVLDNYARWRITDPLLFYQTLRTIPQAQSRLVDIVYSELRVVVGRYTLGQLVSSSDDFISFSAMQPDENGEVLAQQAGAANVEQEMEQSTRQTIMLQVIEQANTVKRKNEAGQDEVFRLSEVYGIEVVDVRIKRTDLPTENQEAIFDRMQAERERQAKQYRSEGEEKYKIIRSDAERQAAFMLAEARREAEILHGEGDAEAIRIFNDAISKSPEFYEFYRSLEAYKNSLKDNSRIVLQPGNEFLRFFQ